MAGQSPTIKESFTMNESLTHEEIMTQFDSEWILVGDPQVDKALQTVNGKVLFHSKDRDKVYSKAIELRPNHFAFLYTGRKPDGTAIIL